jgi:iron complex transport system ATP-binding protein
MSVSIRNVSVRHHNAQLLDDVSFEVETGALCVLLGPNGSGKTTLLRAVAGTISHEGDVTIDNVSLRDQPPSERARLLAYTQQEPVFPLEMTVEHFVMLARTPYQRSFRAPTKNDHDVVKQALNQCAIDHLTNRKLGSLSGGEKRRTAFAQAIAQQTSVIVLDEPTTALDIGQQQAMLELIDNIRLEHQKTFIIALHDLTLSQQFATNVAFLQSGKLIDAGPPESVLRLESLESHYKTALAGLSDETTRAIVARRSRTM